VPERIDIRPLDAHNESLVANVHPEGWVNPEPGGRYNLVVLGGGTAGLVTSIGATGLGARVAIGERHLLGGDCLNYGCVPSKSLIRASRVLSCIRNAEAFGVDVPDGVRVDFGAVMERMRRLRAGISRHDSAERLRGLGVDVYLGEARFTGKDSVEIGGKRLRFHRAVIATGARAKAPSIPGLETAGYLTNETLFSLTELPRRLAVIGAGPIGCEMAQSFARFGADVVLLERSDRLLPREEEAAGEILRAAFRRDGIDLRLGVEIVEIVAGGEGKTVRFLRDGEKQSVTVDEILVGIGRAPNVEGLGLEAAGVDYDARTGVRVDDRLRTTNPRIYAAGDVCSRYKFTHSADAMARIVIRNALFAGRSKASALTIPWSTYTDPEVAHVGITEAEIEEKQIPVDTYVQELDGVDRAVLDGEEEGYVRIHVRKGTDRILGATVVASHAGDLISEITLAMTAGLGLKAIAGTIHPYPTQGEAIKRVGDAYFRGRMTPFLGRLFSLWFKLRR
jgi:pyruvate/2-oxoglutarate dehydrogenase complex dihydrolipoamide dehydrogenase (E3) component